MGKLDLIKLQEENKLLLENAASQLQTNQAAIDHAQKWGELNDKLKAKIERLESDIKALREENTKCKELSWEAANEILRLKKEIERLEAEVLKEKFPEN